MTDSKESVRIGAPPAPGDAPPVLVVKPKRMRWEVPITVAVVGVLLAIGASAVGILKARTAPSAVAPSALATSGPAVLSEPAACAAIVPPATDGLRELTAVFENPDRDTTTLAAITAELRAVEAITPETLRQDLVVVDASFEGVAEAHGDRGRIAAAATGESGNWSDAVSRIIARCRQYAAP